MIFFFNIIPLTEYLCVVLLLLLLLLSFFISHIPSILSRPSWQGQECSYSDFSCRVAYYLSLYGTSNTRPCLGANSLCQSPFSSPPSNPPLLLFFSPLECLARRHAVSQHPALNEKGFLKFIRGWRLRGPVGLPATFLPFQHRTRETEQRERPFIWGFFLWTNSPFSRPWYPWISHSAKKDHQPDRARCIWEGNRVRNNSIPEGHPSLHTPGNRVPRSSIMGIQHSSEPHTQGGWPLWTTVICHCLSLYKVRGTKRQRVQGFKRSVLLARMNSSSFRGSFKQPINLIQFYL